MTAEATSALRTHRPLVDRVSAFLPPLFFGPAAAFLATALLASPLLASGFLVYFYQAQLLALTHMITLGWVSMAMIGVLYRYLPALVKRQLPAPRVALAQWATFVLGVIGLVVHFWMGLWSATAWAAGLVLVSAVLLCVNLWPLLWSAPRRGAAEVGVFASTGFLVAAAGLGTLLAVHKIHPVLGGGMLTNLGAHVHLAALGWVGITVCALSFRFLPAFLLPRVDATETARRLVVALAALVLTLAVALLARSAWAWPTALAVAAVFLGYAGLALRVIASHQLPLDWTAWHAVASALWCIVAVAAGTAVVAAGAESEIGAHLAAAYGIAGLLGWVSNLLIGVSYKLFPAFVMAARHERGRAPVPIPSLGVAPRLRPAIFALFNLGVALSVGALVAGSGPALVTGTVLLALAGAAYGGSTLRTVAFVLVDPPASTDPLAVLP